ncbi:MAG TPA: glycoside hydrolase domain-containing protein [Candidatus Dormibacteraeota bacterium]|nr:glycoside hydrolase domain-containing protein [Candidatus Dormibacteraeota bacterium]
MAIVATQLVTVAPAVHAAAAAPCPSGDGACSPDSSDGLQISLPDGSQPCPGSGVGASCLTSDSGEVAPGTPSTPDGQTPCAASSMLSTPAACSTPIPESRAANPPAGGPSVEPSVPVSTIRTVNAPPTVTLRSSAAAAVSGGSVLLTATAASSVLGAGSAIQIFDTASSTLIGSCSQGTQCAVNYSADGGVHRFQAFVAGTPGDSIPAKSAARSDAISVGWIGVRLVTTQTALGPGKGATLTATSTVPVEQFGYSIQLLDADRMTPLTYCSRGTNCSVSITDAVSGAHDFAASVGATTSSPVSVTWLAVSLTGTQVYRAGGSVHLVATANADLSKTPWSIGIVDDHGHLVAPPCTGVSTCTADVTISGSTTPSFIAVVGQIPPAREEGKVVALVQQVSGQVSGPSALTSTQAHSAAFKPARILWGVDSCKALTGDPTGEVLPGVAAGLGTPEFWGRYLTTTMCPALSSAEVATAHAMHMAILPIYNDFDCSSVSGYDTAAGYAKAAVVAARNLKISTGSVIAVDIEPPGPYCSGAVDAPFIHGWYDGITAAGYVPVFYGNGTPGSEFATAWCQAQSEQGDIATRSFIWSFEPSLPSPGWSKWYQPDWSAYATGCPDSVAAWQYQIDVFSPNPNIDSDEALSTLPLWYP